MITINKQKGFQLTFPNGWTVSVQIGGMNYCANRDLSDISFNLEEMMAKMESSEPCVNAEIAAFKPTEDKENDEWHCFEDGQFVQGWVDVTEILKFMVLVSEKPS